ncbi:MAG: hypothetical protein R3C03_20685 [Pirellulaceae bacterium]
MLKRISCAAICLVAIGVLSSPGVVNAQCCLGKLGQGAHQARANLFGGSNCGRGISYGDAAALWSEYCYEDCSLSGGCGGGCNSGCGGAVDQCGGCGGDVAGYDGCASGFLGHSRGHCKLGGLFKGRLGGVGGGGCNLGCFGWPSSCGSCGSSFLRGGLVPSILE